MKYLMIVLLAAAGVFMGCSETSNNLLSPNVEHKEIISLPEPSGLQTEMVRQKSKFIDGNIGGKISISYFYISLGGIAILNADLTIPAGAFSGTKEITMRTNDQLAAVDFYPEMVFDKPLIFDYTIIGLNIYALGLNKNNVSFDFIAQNGSTQPVNNDGIFLNIGARTLHVENARLVHFSRYAFTKHSAE